MSVLADFGIKNIDDFERFMDNKDLFQGANAPQPTEEWKIEFWQFCSGKRIL